MDADLEILRRFEPILRFTHGEYFFPMSVDPYVAECDLWALSADGDRTLLAPRGELNQDDLPAWKARVPDQRLFLRYIQEPLQGMRRRRADRPPRPRFSAPSRLSRVGILARLIDAGFDLSLLLRGSVPGGTVAAAEVKYARARAANPAPSYYGRVVRDGDWTICHYLFFYAMNDWRSSFAGANDHEADWEQCFVFLESRPDGNLSPAWFARAAHDEVGADLRRRWDDAALMREGDHPVIFAGAGSHAAYIEPGEYLQSVPLRLPARMRGFLDAALDFWSGTLRQGTRGRARTRDVAAVAFVDYARGDGTWIGPGQTESWVPILIDDDTPWVSGYDGLFGLDTQDRFAGERAPAGPKFNRDGSPRQSWIDPVGFAGLLDEVPPAKREAALDAERHKLDLDLKAVLEETDQLKDRVHGLGIRADAGLRSGRSPTSLGPVINERDSAMADVSRLQRRAYDLRIARGNVESELQRVRAGDFGDPRRHLRFVARPQEPGVTQRSWLLDLWSALGVAAAILLLGGLIIFGVEQWWLALPAIVFGYGLIEAVVRRRLLLLLLNLTVVLAVIGSLILIVTYWLTAIALLIVAVGAVILRDNLGELLSAGKRP